MKNRNLFLIFFLLLAPFTGYSREPVPRLVVGIVVDQMRPDYLARFRQYFTAGGFNRLVDEGYAQWNVHYNYVPTYTGPGHASIFSGTTPRFHGITGNYIHYRDGHQTPYCVSDTFRVIGNPMPGKANGPSPARLLSTNLCDELKLFSGRQSRCIAMSLKDRAAILSAGHLSDIALWFDQKTGNFVTSSWYSPELPGWVTAFNQRRPCDTYCAMAWKLLDGDDTYTGCDTDTALYAVNSAGKKMFPVFPHDLHAVQGTAEPAYSALYNSPMANSMLTDLALEAIRHSGLGTGPSPDLLIISFSSTDAVGHIYGPRSREVMDTYLRLDRDLDRLITLLDSQIGRDQYVLFLTADHGVADVPKYLQKIKIHAGYTDHNAMLEKASAFMEKQYSPGDWVDTLVNDQIYLNRGLIGDRGLDLRNVQDRMARLMEQQPGIAFAYTASALGSIGFTGFPGRLVGNGFNPSLCGDVMLVGEPEFFEYGKEYLTEHGSVYEYDTHVPLLWYGMGIPRGESWNPHEITDIAPTVARILRIPCPNASIGTPMDELFLNR